MQKIKTGIKIGIKIGIIGKGKLGSNLAEYIQNETQHEVAGVYERNNEIDLATFQKNCDILIDCSTSGFDERANEITIPIIIASTQVRSITPNCPVLDLPLANLGWHLTTNLLMQLAKTGEYSFDICEIHHKHKKDAPSGATRELVANLNAILQAINSQANNSQAKEAAPMNTQNSGIQALEKQNLEIQNSGIQNLEMQASGIQNLEIQNLEIQNSKVANSNIQNSKIENSKIENSKIENAMVQNPKIQIELSSHRIGQVVGIHSIIAISEHDMIKIEHQSFSRKAFSHGLVNAAVWLIGKAHQGAKVYKAPDWLEQK